MLSLPQKITAGLATGALVSTTFATSAFAATNVHISGNGSRSNNDVSISQEHRTTIDQRNNADINNDVRVNSNTGNNRANGNTGGDVFLGTGNSETSVHISNHANMNHASIGGSNGGNGGHNMDWFMNHFMGRKLHASLNGAQEVPGPGDPDGTGWAKVRVHPGSGKLCVEMQVSNIDTATAAHIHEAPVGAAGPVVVTLPTPNSSGYASGCMTVDMEQLKEIKSNPSDYYVNVHNVLYPNGAVRGQLSR